MKTRKTYTKNVTVQQGGGCCGSTPIQTKSTQNSSCRSSQIEEQPQNSGGCCS